MTPENDKNIKQGQKLTQENNNDNVQGQTTAQETDKNTKQNLPLTPAERAEIQQFFISIVSEMKKHGLPDVGLLKKAFEFALEKHGDTRRKTGEPYILHPLHVAKILADCGHESDMVASAMLHDVIEDCGVTKHDMEIKFGVAIADIVDAVSKVSAVLAPDETMSKLDLDDLSDMKFLAESTRVKKAVYIKCADRIHNLRTISIFPEQQQQAKAYHTRSVIIPAAKKLHIHNMTDILGDLCLKIENPEKYKNIKDIYDNILKENKDTLSGTSGLIEETRRMILEDGRLRPNIAEVAFVQRTVDGINEELINRPQQDYDVKKMFSKHTIPIYDIYFIVDDLYMDTPENLFFACYDRLHESQYHFTITGCHKDDYETYYHLTDWYGNMYRLFIQSETENMEFTHGSLISTAQNDEQAGLTENCNEKMIPVFKKDGSPMMIEDGATVLDLAFSIDPNIGICAKYAFINGSKTQAPIYSRLKPGDLVEVVSDHDKHQQLKDVPHATVRWFEYLHTRSAVKSLSRWLEKHMDSAIPSMPVYDSKGQEYEIDMAATVLDFAFLIDEQVGLHVQKAYINKCQTPVGLDTTLRYRDKVRFEFDSEDAGTPVFGWLGIVKTKKAKDCLIEYFNRQYSQGEK